MLYTKDNVEEIFEEDTVNKFTEMVDLGEWKEARSYLANLIDSGMASIRLAESLNKYFQDNLCKECLGTGEIVDGEFDDQLTSKCICQIEK